MERLWTVASMLSARGDRITTVALKSLPIVSTASSYVDQNNLLRDILRYAISLSLFSLFFFLRLLLSLFPSSPSSSPPPSPPSSKIVSPFPPPPASTSSAVARSLSHILSAMSRVPVASRKYALIQSMADRAIDGNSRLGSPALDAVNRSALSAAFSATLRRIEAAVRRDRSSSAAAAVRVDRTGNPVVGAVRFGLGIVKEAMVMAAAVAGAEADEEGRVSAEKMAVELLWLAKKMEGCGAVGEAVARWGSATELARLALSAEPRLQGSLVRVSAFLFNHIKEIEDDEGSNMVNGYRMEMLMSWLPLLCCASNGIDVPVLSGAEKTEVERVLDEIIGELSNEEQEEVLAMWLHHFTTCPNSDWPDLMSSYTRWYTESRRLFLIKY
ncbi:hypothetical protein QJS04_geneDACA014560 [Acorus gramineus]|uniref:Uncharacterized protein n=1 Tax=Acorus gramineus TaxID=55184 RepID=A0AAV9AP54_ACOGR|nr:hypothetical protein QJS04_geneDACA014560 [Acorus gramineus]